GTSNFPPYHQANRLTFVSFCQAVQSSDTGFGQPPEVNVPRLRSDLADEPQLFCGLPGGRDHVAIREQTIVARVEEPLIIRFGRLGQCALFEMMADTGGESRHKSVLLSQV